MESLTREVVERFLTALAAADTPAALDCCTEDVVFVPLDASTLRGRAAFGEELDRLFSGVFAPGTYVRHNEPLIVEGELAILVWRAECLGTVYTHGVTHFVLRGPRIGLVTVVEQGEPV
ncbi:MAG: nuclear transport factor 2 family protein [Thermoleophilia bacterium]